MKAKMAPLLRTLLLAAACATLGPLEWRAGTAEAGSGMPCGDTIPDCNGVCPGTTTCMPNMNNDACNCVQLGCCQAGANCISGDVSFICIGVQGQFVPNGRCGVECLPAGAPTSTPTPTVPPIPCGDTIPDCDGVCPGTTTCMPNMNNDACNCVQLGCCQAGANCISGDVSFICIGLQGQFVPNGTCGAECQPGGISTSTPTPTASPTRTPSQTSTLTPTVTPTNTLVPDGGTCTDPVDCVSGNCVDDTCCADPSCPVGESCDNPENPGICSPEIASAAAISQGGVWLAVALLVAIGGLAVARRRRITSS